MSALDVPDTYARRRIDPEHGTLVGSRCPSCGAMSWPSRAVCHRCGGVMTLEVSLPREGTLMSYTTVWIPRPGLPAPYSLGQVQFADCVFFAHVRGLGGSPRVPMTVRVVLAEPDSSIDFWLEPTGS
jgi:uncharacterized OB-fold protein